MLDENQKEAALQVHKIKRAMDELGTGAQRYLASKAIVSAGAYVAHKHIFDKRFGVIATNEMTLVFANMGPESMDVLERLKDVVDEEDIEVLGDAVWPMPLLDEPYTWAVLIEDDDHEYWLNEAMRLHYSHTNDC